MPCFERNVLLHDGTQQKFLRPFGMQPSDTHVIPNHANFFPIIPCTRTGAGEGLLRGSPVTHSLDVLIGGRF